MSVHVVCTEKRCIVFPHPAICMSVRTPVSVNQVNALSILLHFHLVFFPSPSIYPLCSSSVCAPYFPAHAFTPVSLLWLPSICLSFLDIRTTAVLGSRVILNAKMARGKNNVLITLSFAFLDWSCLRSVFFQKKNI